MKKIDKAVLKTIIYSDIFNFPLKGWEIHKWLIELRADLMEVEEALNRLIKQGLISNKDGYFYLTGRDRLVRLRQKRAIVSSQFWPRAKMAARLLKLIPWIEVVGVSGGLARNNVDRTDDIDLFVITKPGRMWLSRLLGIILIDLTGWRRLPNQNDEKSAHKICLNVWIDGGHLALENSSVYLAHEVLQSEVVWQRRQSYYKFLAANQWVFDWLPNWVGVYKPKKNQQGARVPGWYLTDYLESVARYWQLKIMSSPRGEERVNKGQLFFHPLDYRQPVEAEFLSKCRLFKL